MNTTAGPKRYPRYSVFSDAGRFLGHVHRDAVNPYWWVASRKDKSRIEGIDCKTMAKAMTALRDMAARNVL